MFFDDSSDKESENYDSVDPDEIPVNKNYSSTVEFIKEQDKTLPLKAAHSFTGTINEFRLTNNNQNFNLCDRMRTINLNKGPTLCPCGCLLRPKRTGPFRTREASTLALHVAPPEILQHHGHTYQPSDIAMFWKKDCRKYLWKGKSKDKKRHNDSQFI